MKNITKIKNIFKCYISYIIYLIFFSKKKNDIWLIGERLGTSANDNGFSFFRYLIDNKKLLNTCYFIYEDSSLLNNELKEYANNSIKMNSFKHFIFYFRTKYAIVSHGIKDVVPETVFYTFKLSVKPIIYLQHGIVKFKKIYYNRESYNKLILRFISSTKDEQDIICNKMMPKKLEHEINLQKYKIESYKLFKSHHHINDELLNYISKVSHISNEDTNQQQLDFLNSRIGFERARAPICGLSRFDDLIKEAETNKKSNQILIFPTWRDELKGVDIETFLNSDYYNNYKRVLTDKKLLRALSVHGFTIVFHLHSEMMEFYEQFSYLRSDVVVISEEKNIKSLILSSDMLITDYSSIAWDFHILGRRVMFYHFDNGAYQKQRSNYCSNSDVSKDWFGDVFLSADDLNASICNALSNKLFVMEKLNIPKNCSSSIYDEISSIPKKVYILVYNIYGIGGTVRTTINNANYLYKEGFDVEIISVKRTSFYPKLGLNPGVKIKNIFDARNNGAKYKKFHKSLVKNVFNLSVRLFSRFDSILIDKEEDLYKNFSLFTDLNLYRVLKSLNDCNLITTIPSFNMLAPKIVNNTVNVIGQEHKSFLAHEKKMQDKIKKSYGKLTHLTVLTDDDYFNYKEIMNENTLSVLPNATEIPKGIEFNNRKPKSIVTLARFSKEKRIDLLIEAFSKVVKNDSECILNIYGDGILKPEMRQLVKDKGLDNNIFINDAITDLKQTLSNQSIFALSSEAEGFGMVIIEANAHGLPVVSFDIPNGPKTLIEHQETGLKAKPFDIDEFAEHILTLVNNETLRVQLARNAYQRVVENYSLDSVGKKIEKILR